jgi:hypothetical protein
MKKAEMLIWKIKGVEEMEERKMFRIFSSNPFSKPFFLINA